MLEPCKFPRGAQHHPLVHRLAGSILSNTAQPSDNDHTLLFTSRKDLLLFNVVALTNLAAPHVAAGSRFEGRGRDPQCLRRSPWSQLEGPCLRLVAMVISLPVLPISPEILFPQQPPSLLCCYRGRRAVDAPWQDQLYCERRPGRLCGGRKPF